jgi:hypothetical protein
MPSLLVLLLYTAKQDTNLVVCFRFCWLYWRSKVAVDIMVHQGGWLGQHSNSAPLAHMYAHSNSLNGTIYPLD